MQDSMSVGRILWPIITLGATGVIFAQLTSTSGLQQDDLPLVVDELFYVKPQISVAQLLEARGYRAQEFFFTSKDGYKLCITRGTNPLINNGERGLDHKLPMFFVHGTTVPSTSFILNSAGVRPKVYDTRGIDMRKMTTEELAKIVEGDPSAKSLPFLAMNFGYEVWILDRRGILRSRGKLGHENRTLIDALRSLPTSLLGNAIDAGFRIRDYFPREGRTRREARIDESDSELSAADSEGPGARPKRLNLLQALFTFAKLMRRDWLLSSNKIKAFIDTFDPGYWSYSLDEQVEFDYPQAVDLILNETGKNKVHVVGMSVGGGLTLLALAEEPELADKISETVLWAPFTIMGQDTFIPVVARLISLVGGYVGPFPFPFILPEIEALNSILCSNEVAMEIGCEQITDIFAGYSAGQSPMRLSFVSSLLRPVSILELTHLGQLGHPEAPCKYQFNTRAENIKKYGQTRAPCYDLSRVRLRNIKFYVGGTDFLASPSSIKATISKMTVPTELKIINGSGIFFNHLGFFLHKQADKLVVLPTLLDFERSSPSESGETSVIE